MGTERIRPGIIDRPGRPQAELGAYRPRKIDLGPSGFYDETKTLGSRCSYDRGNNGFWCLHYIDSLIAEDSIQTLFRLHHSHKREG